ncbi:deoxyribonuclease V [Nodosilinea sp. LEGE 07088]|uniref:deoxyribonuclease V n=1 Tax=Nodosilinea sp. LEGE 07088 TaxID=2777968 RepID=UPI001882CB29|nr:deoxyribonuclease V [Nodosilinea sp. LEGE 07088]MBE9140226.1 deoxyribonuclease V [Nodosilinea sp. LEGE 07088]
MQIQFPESWPTTSAEAIALQHSLAPQIVLEDRLPDPIRFVAGVDAGFEDEGRTTRAAVVVLSFPDLTPVDEVLVRRPTTFPYVPGLLSFREVPAVLAALAQLQTEPDVMLCDGQGIAHPRRLGIASHLGLLCGCPTIGVAKSRLVGTHIKVPTDKGAWVPLVDRGEQIGAVLRNRANTKPLYISVGHCVSLETAIDLVLRCTTKYRLPETTRYADRLASSGKGQSALGDVQQGRLF